MRSLKLPIIVCIVVGQWSILYPFPLLGQTSAKEMYKNMKTIPVTGKWTAGGRTGIGYIDKDTGTWHLYDSEGHEVVKPFPYGDFSHGVPVVGDWDGNGIDGILTNGDTISNVSLQRLDGDSLLDREFNLAGKHSQETQYFLMESRLITYALDGRRVGTDIFRLRLKCVPAGITGGKGDEYTCARFTLQQGEAPEMEIPALKNWTYVFGDVGIDAKGQVFGIDHAKFENLTDRAGNAISPDKAYHVYNAFIDFHSFCNVFAVGAGEGKGIQDLKKIGQRIVHAAAFSEAPVNVGSNVAEGSYFRNGEITLTFKGLSAVNGRQCALVEYDSGESSFKMIMRPMPNMEILAVGSSHYRGDIYKDIATNWVQMVTMNELVVSETTLPMPPNKSNSVVERIILIHNVGEKEFGAD